MINTVAQLCTHKIIKPDGAFNREMNLPGLGKDASGKMQYTLVPEKFSQEGSAISISQKDIRSVQLGKAALISGIEFLLKEAGRKTPEKIIIAGAFGTYLDKQDMMTLGMIPVMDMDRIEIAGNSAGAGAVMTLCDDRCLERSIQMVKKITTIDLACSQAFQEVFVQQLGFPDSAACQDDFRI